MELKGNSCADKGKLPAFVDARMETSVFAVKEKKLVQKKTFNLEESLKRKLPYKPYTGEITGEEIRIVQLTLAFWLFPRYGQDRSDNQLQ